MADSDVSQVERILAELLQSEGIGVPGAAERRSWRMSLPVLARDLRDAGLGGIEVIPEHRLPLSSRRTDAVLAGVHPKTGAPSYLVIELKQWSTARRWRDDEGLVHVDGARYSPVLHPSAQVAQYVDYLTDFTTVLAAAPSSISGAAYLHNAMDTDISDLWGMRDAARAGLFTGQRRGAFHDFLRSRFSEESGADAADALLSSTIAPSKHLLDVAAKEIREREQFVLLDEQLVAFKAVLNAVRDAHRDDHKSLVVIAGGPGSGKSVIALSLLGELAREGRTVLHATGSQSFTTTLRKVAGARSPQTRSLFKYFNSFMDAERNSLDVLVLDEAHRLREKSVNRYTPKSLRERARPQLEELVDVARVPVFLLDQFQVVRPGEMGSVGEIEAYAAERGIEVRHIDLLAQFRSGGSEAYLDWVLRLLGLRGEGPVPWHDEDRFSVDVVDSPAELESRLSARLDDGLSARMTAGYCWPWSDPRADGTLVADVTVGDWAKPWNLRSDRRVGDAPPSPLWATEPGGFGQVGCVYTAQGFEYDWNGVILGRDLVWRGGHGSEGGRWVAQREFNRDPDFRFRAAVDDAQFDRLVRHVYKVLLTRGMVGTLLYSEDEETREMLASLVNPLR